MSTEIAYPYLRPPADSVSNVTWSILTPHFEGALRSELKGWDYATDLTIRVKFMTDVSKIARACQLGDGLQLTAVLNWFSSQTKLRGSSVRVPLITGANTVELQLDGGDLGGILVLTLEILLARVGQSESPLAPSKPGSRLWAFTARTVLEGDAARFPVELRDFKATGLRGTGALWALSWDNPDPGTPSSAAIRLLVNSKHPRREALLGPDSDTSIESMLELDIVRQLIDHACTTEFEEGTYPEGTLGAAIMERLRAVFPDLSLEDCRTMRRNDRHDFETQIQEAVGFLGQQ